jgi:Flp pilus assembly protein TadD
VNTRKLAPLLVIIAGLLAYHNSLTGGFVSDDVLSIQENPTIRRLWPIWQCLSPPHWGGLTAEGRPLVNLSLAINYAVGGYHVWGYHAANLAIHILAGLTLLGIVRRTLLRAVGTWCSTSERPRSSAALPDSVAAELALATAILWMVHPLQTESVTYIVQRAESMMGLFYLFTLYGFIRGVESHRPRVWYGLSVAACALGMATKEVMVSAPVMVLLYDRAFLSASFREAWRRRRSLYLGLAATWILLGIVLATGQGPTTASMAQRIGLRWWQYLATEPGVILYYLRLSVWPSPLCLDCGWPIVKTWASGLPSALVIVVLLGATVWAWIRKPAPAGAGQASKDSRQAWGFVGAWFFLILAPSSSFIPLQDAIHEHRMYLPLAAVVSVVVMGIYSVLGRKSLAVFVAAAVGLGFLTWRRNQDYRDEMTIRLDAVARFPRDPVVHYNLGVTLVRLNRLPEAIEQFKEALELKPDFAWAHYSLAGALARQGRAAEAIEHYKRAYQIQPDYAEAHNNLGFLLANEGRLPEAIEQFEQVLRIRPDDTDARNNLGATLAQSGRLQEAVEQFELALRFKPDDPGTQFNLGNALLGLGRTQEAMTHYEEAVRLNPGFVEAQKRLAALRAESGKR